MISVQNRFIFVHIGKTGGSSIESALVPSTHTKGELKNTTIDNKHWSASQYKQHYPNEFQSYFTFSFVRNPWDKVVSEYYWRRYCGIIKNNSSFEEWIVNRDTDDIKLMLIDNGEIAVNFIGRFENLHKDFQTVCNKIEVPIKDLPHSNNLSNRPHYSTHYNCKTKNYIAEVYEWSISSFGYKFT